MTLTAQRIVSQVRLKLDALAKRTTPASSAELRELERELGHALEHLARVETATAKRRQRDLF